MQVAWAAAVFFTVFVMLQRLPNLLNPDARKACQELAHEGVLQLLGSEQPGSHKVLRHNLTGEEHKFNSQAKLIFSHSS